MDNDTERIYYSISEVSQMLNLTFPTLRYWEKMFDDLTPRTNAHQTRFYTPQDIELLRQIKYMREEQGLSIKAIQRKLKVSKSDIEYKDKIVANLKQIRQELVELRAMM